MEELLVELIKALKSASPEIWEILLKQVFISIVQNLVWAVIFVVPAMCLPRWGKHFWGRHQEDEYAMWDFFAVLAYVASGICGLVAISCLIDLISKMINPEYYAIQLILQTLK